MVLLLPEQTGERVGRAVPAAPDIPGRSSTTRSGRSGRLSLPGQQLLNGGQIPGARRLQQFLLLPHLTAAEKRSHGHTNPLQPLQRRNTHPRATQRAFFPLRSARSSSGGCVSVIPAPIAAAPGKLSLPAPAQTSFGTARHVTS